MDTFFGAEWIRFCSLVMILSGCGRAFPPQKDQEPLPRKPVPQNPLQAPYRNTLVSQAIYDLSCQNTMDEVALDGVAGRVYQDQNWVELALAAGYQSGDSGVFGPAVAKTKRGLFTLAMHELAEDAFGRLQEVRRAPGFEVVEPSRPLMICNPKASFPERSEEHAALSALVSLEKARTFYQQTGAEFDIEPLHLEVFPQMVNHYRIQGSSESFNTYVTDNAAFGRLAGDSYIFIFPRSQEALNAGFFPDFDLWQSPVIIAHEYGHHIFLSLLQQVTARRASSALLSLVPTQVQPYLPALGKARWSFVSGDVQARGQKMLTAINEGFADLYATYAMADASGLLQGHTCMEYSRDVKSDVFGDGVNKVWTKERLTLFFEGDESMGSAGCDRPDWSGVHTVGAVWAYGIDQILALGTANGEKGRDLLSWLETWFRREASDHAVAIGLDALEALLAGQNFTERLDEACMVVKDVWPGLSHSPLLQESPESWPLLSRCSPR